jgi:hypothetical protein
MYSDMESWPRNVDFLVRCNGALRANRASVREIPLCIFNPMFQSLWVLVKLDSNLPERVHLAYTLGLRVV